MEQTRLPVQVGDGGSSPTRPHLELRLGSPVTRGIFDGFVRDNHSYVDDPSTSSHIWYFIDLNDELRGVIGFGMTAPRIPGAVLRAFAMGSPRADDPSSLHKLRKIAWCHRYAVKDGFPPGYASKCLATSIRLLRNDWLKRYDERLIGVVTFVRPPWLGTCFKAANFKLVGYTSGEQSFIYKNGVAKSPNRFVGEKLRIYVYRYK